MIDGKLKKKKMEEMEKILNENKLEWFSHENNLKGETKKKVRLLKN